MTGRGISGDAPRPSPLAARYARAFTTTAANNTSVIIRPPGALPSRPSYPPSSHSWWTDKRGPVKEHEDPNHPVVALATRRIEELSARKRALTDAIDAVKVERPAGHRPDDILALLDALPDLRPALTNATEDELADIFEAFDASITYDKPNGRLILAATIRPDLDPKLQNDDDRPGERSLISQVAGERFAPICDLGPLEQVIPSWPGS